VDRATEIFASMGDVGRRALTAAVKRKGQPRRDLLEEILGALA
jgi:hypothetical protein